MPLAIGSVARVKDVDSSRNSALLSTTSFSYATGRYREDFSFYCKILDAARSLDIKPDDYIRIDSFFITSRYKDGNMTFSVCITQAKIVRSSKKKKKKDEQRLRILKEPEHTFSYAGKDPVFLPEEDFEDDATENPLGDEEYFE